MKNKLSTCVNTYKHMIYLIKIRNISFVIEVIVKSKFILFLWWIESPRSGQERKDIKSHFVWGKNINLFIVHFFQKFFFVLSWCGINKKWQMWFCFSAQETESSASAFLQRLFERHFLGFQYIQLFLLLLFSTTHHVTSGDD